MRNEEFDVAKIPGTANPADMLTKNVQAYLFRTHTEALGIWIDSGRAKTDPKLCSITGNLQGGNGDTWEQRHEKAVRFHSHPRYELCTPLGIVGAPPGKTFTP